MEGLPDGKDSYHSAGTFAMHFQSCVVAITQLLPETRIANEEQEIFLSL
jgi:hypothetical protein